MNMLRFIVLGSFLFGSFAGAFDKNALEEVESFTTGYRGQGPYKLEDSKLVFAIEGSMSSLSKSNEASSGNRYFYRQRAQGDAQYMVSFRFDPELERKNIHDQGVSPRSISFYKNREKSMEFRNLELSANGKSITTYQECWQPSVKEPKVQCGLVNKIICDQINRGNYDWDKSYRKAAQAYRAQMNARFQYEAFPEDLNKKKGMGFGKYETMSDYTYEHPELLYEFPSAIRMRLASACKSFPFSDTYGPNETFKH